MSTRNVNQAVLDACAVLGSQKALATALNVLPPSVSDWVFRKRPVPLARCIQIEKLTGGRVTCEQLNSDINWLELRGLAPMPVKRPRARISA